MKKQPKYTIICNKCKSICKFKIRSQAVGYNWGTTIKICCPKCGTIEYKDL